MRGRGLATGQAERRKGLPEKAAVKPDVRGQGTCPPPPSPGRGGFIGPSEVRRARAARPDSRG